MAGLVPAIHVFRKRTLFEDVDARHMAGMTECFLPALEQLLDIGELELDVSWPPVIALA